MEQIEEAPGYHPPDRVPVKYNVEEDIIMDIMDIATLRLSTDQVDKDKPHGEALPKIQTLPKIQKIQALPKIQILPKSLGEANQDDCKLIQTPTCSKKAKDAKKKKKSPKGLKRKLQLDKVKKPKKGVEKEPKKGVEKEHPEKDAEPSKKKRKTIKLTCKPPMPLKDRIRVHGRNRDPIQPNHEEIDCDFSWEMDFCERDLEDLTDTNSGEKKLMLMWNKFIYNFKKKNRMANIFLKKVHEKFLEEHGLDLIKGNLYRTFLCHLMALYRHNLMNNKDILDLGCKFQEIMADNPVERDLYIGKPWRDQKLAWIDHVNKKGKGKKKKAATPAEPDLPDVPSLSPSCTPLSPSCTPQSPSCTPLSPSCTPLSPSCTPQSHASGTDTDPWSDVDFGDLNKYSVGQPNDNEQDISEGETDEEIINNVPLCRDDDVVSFSPSSAKRKKISIVEEPELPEDPEKYPILEKPKDDYEARIKRWQTLLTKGYDPYTGIPV